MLFYFFTSSIILIVFYIFYLGTFNRVKIIEHQYKGIRIVYTDYVGNYHAVGAKIGEVCSDAKTFFKTQSCLGIYYDSPKEIIDPNQGRATIGVILEPQESPSEMISSFKGKYQYTEIPSTATLYSKFPYRNILSILIGHIFKVLPKLTKEGEARNIKNNQMVEVYNLGGEGKCLEYFIPLSDSYFLTKLEAPDKKV